MVKRQYPGELGKVGLAPPIPIFDSPNRHAIIAETVRLLDALREHLSVEAGPDQWLHVALELARRHVPAFQLPPNRSKWTGLSGGVLVVEVERCLDAERARNPRTRVGALWAAKRLAASRRWASFIQQWEGSAENPSQAIYKQYNLFKKKKWVDLMRRAFRYHEASNSLAEWEQLVDDVLRDPGRKDDPLTSR